MALILVCEGDIDPTGSAVTCVRNDTCDMILQLYPSGWCQNTPLKKTENMICNDMPKMLYVQHFWHGGEVACCKGKKACQKCCTYSIGSKRHPIWLNLASAAPFTIYNPICHSLRSYHNMFPEVLAKF